MLNMNMETEYTSRLFRILEREKEKDAVKIKSWKKESFSRLLSIKLAKGITIQKKWSKKYFGHKRKDNVQERKLNSSIDSGIYSPSSLTTGMTNAPKKNIRE